MRIVFIGSQGGHYNSVFTAAAADPSLELLAYAPGSPEETDLSSIEANFKRVGKCGKRYDNWQEMVKAEKPDMAIVAPIFCYQAPISIELLKRGINVYSEKTGATTIEQLDELEKAYNESSAEYRTMLTFYYDPAFKKVHDLIKDGAIGEPRLISAQKSYRFGASRPEFYKDVKLYGGTIPWVGIHAITWIHWMSGQRITSAYARASQKANHGYGDLDMSCTVSFKLTNEVLANVNIDFLNAGPSHGDDRIRIAGTKGVIETLHNKVFLSTDEFSGEIEFEHKDENIFAAYVKALSGTPARFDARDCFIIARAALMAQKSSEEGVELPIEWKYKTEEKKMSKKITVMQVGIGGYGMSYLKPILDEWDNDKYELVGIVDPIADKCPLIDAVKEKNIPVYDSIEAFYEKQSADLVVIAAPIGYHCRYTCYALEHGSNVLCEKPVSATIQEARLMRETELKTGKFVAIGFQWSFAEPMIAAKNDSMAGLFGKPLKFKVNVLWSRDWKYYGRNNWAGKLRDSQGFWILDSVAHNATAHYLHNMYYMMGSELDKSAMPVAIECELYRANNIENFDTCALRATMDNGCEALYYVTHAIEFSNMPNFVYTFENGKLVYSDVGADNNYAGNGNMRFIFNDGTVKEYGNPFPATIQKLHDCLDHMLVGKPIPCGVEAATPHLLTINFLADNVNVKTFDKEFITIDEDAGLTYVPGLGKAFQESYVAEKLPSEMGYAWAVKPEKLDCSNYTEFKGNRTSV